MKRSIATILSLVGILVTGAIGVGSPLASAQSAPAPAATTIRAVPPGSPFANAEVTATGDPAGLTLKINDPVARAQKVSITVVLTNWTPADQRIRISLLGRTAEGKVDVAEGTGWREQGDATVSVPEPGTLQIKLDATPKADGKFWIGLTKVGEANAVQHRSPWLSMDALSSAAAPELRGHSAAWLHDRDGAVTRSLDTGHRPVFRVNDGRLVLAVPEPPTEIDGKKVVSFTDSVILRSTEPGKVLWIEANVLSGKVHVIDESSKATLPKDKAFEALLATASEGVRSVVLNLASIGKLTDKPITENTTASLLREIELEGGVRLSTQSGAITLGALGNLKPSTEAPSEPEAKTSSKRTAILVVALGSLIVLGIASPYLFRLVARARSTRRARRNSVTRPPPRDRVSNAAIEADDDPPPADGEGADV